MLAEKNICTGCGACAVSCPLNCIEMKADQEGFRYPVIDTTQCISCHKCEVVCPTLDERRPQTEPKAYAVKHKESSIRISSSSGGIFPALAHFTLANGGAVCGAGYADDFCVNHLIIEDSAEISKLQGAKYAQSCVEHLFPKIQNILECGRLMLFVGTPCQVAGLKAYLEKDYANLILVDMICHGVPSPKVWEKYLRERTALDSSGSLEHINLRSKKSGWSRYSYSVEIKYSDGSIYLSPQGQDWFMRGFTENLYLRRSCGNCNFKGVHRISDLTLGDFWGIWDLAPEFDDNQGVSLLWLNSKKATRLWEHVSDDFDALSIPINNSVCKNPSAWSSSQPHSQREKFFAQVDTAAVIPLIQTILAPTKQKRNLFQRLINRLKWNTDA